jgi:DNA-binding PadR family transcriptional regulator
MFQRYIYFVAEQKRELFDGLIRIHVLLHAAHEPIFGLAMMKELAHHGYSIGPGTLYPLLHGLEKSGLLRSEVNHVEGRQRRLYRITPAGRRDLDKAKSKVEELYHELQEEHPRKLSRKTGRQVPKTLN